MASRIERYLRTLETAFEKQGYTRLYKLVSGVREGIYPEELDIAQFGIGSAISGSSVENFKREKRI